MKKLLLKTLQAVIITTLLAMPWRAKADLLLSDNFDYPIGELYKHGEWVKLTTNTNEPIQVTNSPLSYAGYQATTTGKSVVLNGKSDTKAQRLQKAFSENAVTSGTLYYSLLVKPTEFSQGNTSKYIISGFTGKNYNGWGDGVGNTPYATVSVSKGDTDGKIKFGVAASTSVPTLTTTEYDLNQTYLVVVKYDFSTKDIALWVNPASATAEATITLVGKGSISTTNGVQAVCLYQQGSSLAQGNFIVDAVRVATDMADLFGTSTDPGTDPGTDPTEDPVIIASPPSLAFDAIFQGQTATKTIDILAENLTDDITITSSSPAFKVSSATLTKDEAEAGAQVTVTFAPTAGGNYDGTISIATGGETVETVSVTGSAASVTSCMNYAYASNNLANGTFNEYEYLQMQSSSGTVTYVDAANKRFFIQDMTGALEICCDFMDAIPVKANDKFKKFIVMVMEGKLYLDAAFYNASDITAGTAKSPTPCTLADIQADPQSYWNKLVTIEDLTFANAGNNFAAASTAATDADGKNINVRPFNGTDIIGTEIPASASVTGILVAKDGKSIWPRSLADIEAAAADEPAITVSVKNDFDGVAAPIGQDTKLATLTISAVNLPAAAELWLGGTNRSLFSLSSETIPAGTGTYEVVVTYSPTAIGSHKATVNIDATPTQLSGTYALAAKAYDPENLPTITVPASVDAFAAAAGDTQQQTISIASANMFDYGTVKISSQSTPGTFIINNTSLYPNIPASFNITFKPLVAGTYTATIEVAAPMAETKYIQLTGVATGAVSPDEKEGTELTLDTTNPLTLMIEGFDGVTRNKPLAVAGWDNVAMQGTRAWWGFNFEDNYVAKVTAYDSKADAETPCEMLLVTPALDFKNAASKIFTCRVMGDFLPESGTSDVLEVLYIEDADYMQVFDEMNIPYSADRNKEWVDYVIDFEDYDLADVFFIGFRYKANRGRENTVVYYVDDVSWGRTDVPQIKISHSGLQFNGVLGQTTISEEITVTGKNLTGDITLSVSGANASKFATSTTTLPAEGGKFAVHFTPEEEGVHEAYIDIKADGAPTVSMPVAARASNTTGIESLVGNNSDVNVYNMQGMSIIKSGKAADIKTLPAGYYIINGAKVRIK